MAKNKFIIIFAGAPGSSRTPIAYYLSWKIGLPILNNDGIRTEVVEDLGVFNEEEYIKRRNARIEEVIGGGISFIYDASVDREWQNWKGRIEKSGYEVFIVSLNLSRELLARLYETKGYGEFSLGIDKFIEDHNSFIKQYGNEIRLNISDQDFNVRLEKSYEAVTGWLNK